MKLHSPGSMRSGSKSPFRVPSADLVALSKYVVPDAKKKYKGGDAPPTCLSSAKRVLIRLGC